MSKRSILLAAVCAVLSATAIAFAATNFEDALVFKGGVTFGSTGTAMTDSYAATLTTNFVGVGASTCKDSGAITVTGAASGDICTVGIPTTETAKLSYTCYVSAANAVKIRICNPAASAIDGVAGSAAHNVRTFDP